MEGDSRVEKWRSGLVGKGNRESGKRKLEKIVELKSIKVVEWFLETGKRDLAICEQDR